LLYHSILGHKYGGASSQKAENYNYINNNVNSHDFQNYTKNLNSNINLNSYEVRYYVKIFPYSFFRKKNNQDLILLSQQIRTFSNIKILINKSLLYHIFVNIYDFLNLNLEK